VLKLATQSRHHLGGEEQVERGRDLSQPCHEHPEQAYLAVPEGPGAISGSSAWRLSISRSAIGTRVDHEHARYLVQAPRNITTLPPVIDTLGAY
jgi:hypothetical protein